MTEQTCEALRKYLMLNKRLYFRRIAWTTNIYCEEKKIVVWSQSSRHRDGWEVWEREGYRVIKSDNYQDILNQING